MSYIRALRNHVCRQRLGMAAVAAILAMTLSQVNHTYAFESQSEAAALEASGNPQPQQVETREPKANLPYLFAVFLVTWMAFFGYMLTVSRRQTEMLREITLLRRVIADKNPERAPAVPGPDPRAP